MKQFFRSYDLRMMIAGDKVETEDWEDQKFAVFI